jgi:hypothetical protein
MDVRHAAVARFLEQEIGHTRHPRIVHDFCRHRHDHSIHAGRLGRSAGGFPAMTGDVPFLMKDVVLLAVSFYLLKQDVQRLVRPSATNQRRS